MTENIRGSLFDRLIDPEPYVTVTSPSIKTLTRKELKASIHRELSWLLNSTCAFSQEEMELQERNTLNYGIHDFSCFFPDSSDNRFRLGRVIKGVIESFEPRLQSVNIDVQEMSDKNDRFTLSMVIEAELVVDRVKEPVTFIMAID